MLSVATGHSSSYLTDQVGAGMESYYTGTAGAGEPPGQWYGKGAEALGLTGEVDADVMHGVYGQYRDPRDPAFANPATRMAASALGRAPKQYRTAEQVVSERIDEYWATYASAPTPEQIQEMRLDAEGDVHKAVGFYDLTFSPDKSVTVMHTAFVRAGHEARQAGDAEGAQQWEWAASQVEDALMAASAVGLDYVESTAAYTRTGRHGGKGATGRWEDTPAITAARFLQHTSRDLDPQLHVHQAVLNKVQGADGKWRALDGRQIYTARPGAAAVSERELEVQLSQRLGIAWELREDGIGRRVVGVDRDLEALFSGRRAAITEDAERRFAQFEKAVGREPNNIERTRIMQAATLATRAAKTHESETAEEQYARWQAEAETALAGGLTRQAGYFAQLWANPDATARAEQFSPESVILQALEACHGDDGKATFTRHDLIFQLDRALPANLGRLSERDTAALLQDLADRAQARDDVFQVGGNEIGHVPTASRLGNGAAATIDPSSVQFATTGHLAAEMALLRSAGVRGAASVDRAAIEAWIDESGATLAPAQHAAITALASSDAAMAVLVGPAGTGKSYTAGVLDAAWRELTGSRVVGVAVTQVAADVLADDGVQDSANISAFLAAQGRLASGTQRPGDERWQLSRGDVLLVDEASMVDTPALTRLQTATEATGARLVLMGDPHQLGPVGAGGMMRAAIDRQAETYTLSEVRRFGAEWERDASLLVRAGDVAAVEQYDRHGRILGSGREADAIAAVARAAAADRLAGRDVVVVTGTNKHATQVAAAMRRHLVTSGVVEENGVLLGRDGTVAGIGDDVQARRIDRALGLVNRENYRVTGVREDGGLDVVSTRTGAQRVIPPDYLATDVTLAYASTAHGAQGRTVDVGHVLLTPGFDHAGAYVGLTRGRDSNTAWVITDPGIPDQPIQTGRGLLAGILSRSHTVGAQPVGDGDDLAAVDVAASDEAFRSHSDTLLGLIEDEARVVCRQRLDTDLDQLVADGVLPAEIRARFGAEQGTEHLSRLLRVHEQAGHDPAEVLRTAIGGKRSLHDALSVSQVVASRIDPARAVPVPTFGAGGGVARLPEDRAGYLAELADLFGDRQRDLGSALALEPPAWAVATLGAVPDEPVERLEWETRVGVIAAQREASGWEHPEFALGRCPGVHSPEKRAAWHAAFSAAGMPEERRPEAELSDGRLLIRVRAAERARAAAPPAVMDAQRTQHQAAESARREATLAAAEQRLEDAHQLEAAAAEHAESAARLDEVAYSRAQWLVSRAETFEAGRLSKEELLRRGIEPGAEDDLTTAEQYRAWQDAESEARVADDAHRVITEADVRDQVQADEQADIDAEDAASASQAAELAADQEVPERPQEELSASAVAAEVGAAALHASVVLDKLADEASQEAASSEAAADDGDDWHVHRTLGLDDSTARDLDDSAGQDRSSHDDAWRTESTRDTAADQGTSWDDGWSDDAGFSE